MLKRYSNTIYCTILNANFFKRDLKIRTCKLDSHSAAEAFTKVGSHVGNFASSNLKIIIEYKCYAFPVKQVGT